MIYAMAPVKRKKKGFQKTKLFLTIGALIGLMTYAWFDEDKKAVLATAEKNEYEYDVKQLWEWGETVFKEGSSQASWGFRLDGKMSEEQWLQFMDILFVDDEGKPLPKIVRQNGALIEGAVKDISNAHISIHKQETDTNDRHLIILHIKMESGAIEHYSSIVKLIQDMSLYMSVDSKPELSVKVFGNTELKDPMQQLMRMSLGKTVEEYRDEGTNTKTLYSSLINQYRYLNRDNMVNMQIAVHHPTNGEEDVVTIGIPLISGDFQQ